MPEPDAASVDLVNFLFEAMCLMQIMKDQFDEKSSHL